jgi:hypothetical protein
VLPHAEFAMARILEPALDRITADADATQLLVITADTDSAVAMAAISRSLRDRSVAPLGDHCGTRLWGAWRPRRRQSATRRRPGELSREARRRPYGDHRLGRRASEVLREGEASRLFSGNPPTQAASSCDHLTPDGRLTERHLRRASRQGDGAAETGPRRRRGRYVSTTPPVATPRSTPAR